MIVSRSSGIATRPRELDLGVRAGLGQPALLHQPLSLLGVNELG